MKRDGSFYLLALVLFCAFLFILYAVRDALIPFAVAFLIAYVTDPLLDRMEEKRLPRTLGIGMIFTALVALIVSIGLLLYPMLERQALGLVEEAPRYAKMAQETLAPLMEKYSAFDQQEVKEHIKELSNKLGSLPLEILKGAYRFAIAAFSSFTGLVAGIFGLVVVPVAAFYFMRDIDTINARLYSLVPEENKEEVMETFREINKTLAAFLRGQLTVAMIMAILYSIGLYAIGTPLSLLIGLIGGFSNMVPYLSLVTGFIPAMALTYFHFGFEWQLLAVMGLFAGVQLLEGFLLTPKIMGKSVGLHPVAIMLALMIGGMAFGFVGVLLAVPVAAVLVVVLKQMEKKYRDSDLYAKRSGEPSPQEAKDGSPKGK